jgi:hypothetical protein
MNYSILILDRDSYTDNIPVISFPEKDIKLLEEVAKNPFLATSSTGPYGIQLATVFSLFW